MFKELIKKAIVAANKAKPPLQSVFFSDDDELKIRDKPEYKRIVGRGGVAELKLNDIRATTDSRCEVWLAMALALLVEYPIMRPDFSTFGKPYSYVYSSFATFSTVEVLRLITVASYRRTILI